MKDLFLRLKRLLGGSVRIEVRGDDPYRIINALTGLFIPVKHISLHSNTLLSLVIPACDLPRLRPLLRKFHLRIHIVKKRGFFRRFFFLRERPVLLVGAVVLALAIELLSGFVWSVEVVPNGANDRMISAKLTELGVRTGARKSSISEDRIKASLILEFPELTWAGIFTEGSRITVTYELRTPAPEIIPPDSPASIYASKNGVITRLDVFRGTAAVERGSPVLRGDKLVSSEVLFGENGRFFVHALAAVEARTWYELEGFAASELLYKEYTGSETTRFYLQVGKKRLNLEKGTGIPYTFYDKITYTKLERSDGLPIYLVCEKYREYTLRSEPADRRDFITLGLTDILTSSLSNGRIVSSRTDVGGKGVKMYFECLEDISVTVAE